MKTYTNMKYFKNYFNLPTSGGNICDVLGSQIYLIFIPSIAISSVSKIARVARREIFSGQNW